MSGVTDETLEAPGGQGLHGEEKVHDKLTEKGLQQISDSFLYGERMDCGQLASSQSRVSARNCLRTLTMVFLNGQRSEIGIDDRTGL